MQVFVFGVNPEANDPNLLLIYALKNCLLKQKDTSWYCLMSIESFLKSCPNRCICWCFCRTGHRTDQVTSQKV